MAQDNDLQRVLAALRADYAKALPPKILELQQATREAFASAEKRENARSLAHKLRGTAGSYGFRVLGEAAGKLEDILRNPSSPPEEVKAALQAVIEAASEE